MMEEPKTPQQLLAHQKNWQPDPEVAAFWEKFDLT